MKVLGKMPLIDFDVKCEVVDDENSNVVTAGAIVTVTVELVRRSMSDLFGDTSAKEKQSITWVPNDFGLKLDKEFQTLLLTQQGRKGGSWR